MRKVKRNIKADTPDEVAGVEDSKFEAYLDRASALANTIAVNDPQQPTMPGASIPAARQICGDEVLELSYVDFSRYYKFASAGAGSRGQKRFR